MSGPNGIACGTCVFASLTNTSDPMCRRFPPTVVVVKSINKDDNGTRRFWPAINPMLDWCGEHSVGKDNMSQN